MNLRLTLHAVALQAALALMLGGSAPAVAEGAQDPADPTAAPAAPSAPAQAQLLLLRDGSVRWGEVLSHSPDGLRFRLLANGGEVELAWTQLDPKQETALKTEFGYVDVSSEELLIPVDRLVLASGDEIVGVIVSREGSNFLVKRDGNLQPIPKIRVTSIRSGERVPALDIYSREELYGQYSASLVVDSIESQTELAELCERILDFQHAAEHWAAAAALAPEDEALAFAAERAAVSAKQQAEIDYLRDADMLRKRGKYDEALARLSAFGELFPGSPLLLDSQKKIDRLLRARDAAITKLVSRRWMYWARRHCRDAAGDLALEAATDWATSELPEMILAGVTTDVQKTLAADIQPEEVRQYWAKRRKVRYATASYGLGTWLLGEDGAYAGTESEETAQPASQLDEDRAAMQEKIKRFLDNQRRAQRRAGQQDQAEQTAEYWTAYPTSSRASWILAYYIENGGDYELRDHPTLRNCRGCGGTGALEVIYTGGGGQGGGEVDLTKCITCHGIPIIRRVYFR